MKRLPAIRITHLRTQILCLSFTCSFCERLRQLDPIHNHCATDPWSRTLNNPAFEFGTGGGSITLVISISRPTRLSRPTATTKHPILRSWMSRLHLPLAHSRHQSVTGSSVADANRAQSNPTGPFTFNSGAATSITFNAHVNSADNVLHAWLPGGGVNITIGGLTPSARHHER